MRCVSQLLFISFGCVQADTSYFYFSSSACHNVSVLEFKQILIQSHVIYYSMSKKKKKPKKNLKEFYNKIHAPKTSFLNAFCVC